MLENDADNAIPIINSIVDQESKKSRQRKKWRNAQKGRKNRRFGIRIQNMLRIGKSTTNYFS